jgi:hypothetical protein
MFFLLLVVEVVASKVNNSWAGAILDKRLSLCSVSSPSVLLTFPVSTLSHLFYLLLNQNGTSNDQ